MRTHITVLFAVVVGLLIARHGFAANHQPNILLILADDMGYGDAACYNPDSKIPTPHIDRLAAEGMRFTDAHSPGAWCVPTRYGLLTGRSPYRAELRINQQPGIEAGRLTIASMLEAQGYRTACVGKWHLGFEGGVNGHEPYQPLRGGPVDRGFDDYFGIHASLDIPPYFYIRGRMAAPEPTAHVDASATQGWTDIQGAFWRAGNSAPGFQHERVLPDFFDETIRWVIDHAQVSPARPFFFYLALPAPHTPWLPLEPYRGKSGAGMYGDFMMQVDGGVGRVLGALKDANLDNDTIVIFTSDNGPVWFPPDVERFGHSSVGPLRGMKSDSWEGGHRMPFIVRWPGHIKPGAVNDQLICHTDILATIAAILDINLPDNAAEDSVSFLPVLNNPDLSEPLREYLVLKNNASVIRQGRWKLITHLGSGGFSQPRRLEPRPGGPAGQLYDLQADIGETNNLWQAKPQLVAQLTAALDQIKTAGRSRP